MDGKFVSQKNLQTSRESVDGHISESAFPLKPLIQPCAPLLRELLLANGPKPDESQFLPRPFSPAILNPMREQVTHLHEELGSNRRYGKHQADMMSADMGLNMSMVDYYSNSCTSPDTTPRFGKWLRGKIAQVDRSAWVPPAEASFSSSAPKPKLHTDETFIRQLLPPHAILRSGWGVGNTDDDYELSVAERIEAKSSRYEHEQALRAKQRRKAAAVRARLKKEALQRREEQLDVEIGESESFRPKRTHQKSRQIDNLADALNGISLSSEDEDKGSKQDSRKKNSRRSLQIGYSAFQAKMLARTSSPESPKKNAKPRNTRANRLRRLESQWERKREKHNQDETHRNTTQSDLDERLSLRRRQSLKSLAPKTWLDRVPFKFIAGKPLSAADVVTERCAKAFYHSMDEGSACLQGPLVLHVLCDLGLVPRNQAERKAVSALVDEMDVRSSLLHFEEFERLTERVREQVMMVQQPLFEKHFLQIHNGLSRPISIDFDESRVADLLKSFGCTWLMADMPIVEELRSLFAECPQPEDGAEHDVFQALVQHSQERLAEVQFDEVKRISEETGLTLHLSREFRREVPGLYAQYANWVMRKMKDEEEDQDSPKLQNTKIDLHGMVTILGDIGVMPISERIEGSVRELLSHMPHGLGLAKFFDFNEFLLTIKHIRRLHMKRREPEISPLFEKHARKKKAIDYRGVSQVLCDYGLTPRTWEQQHLVGELMMDLEVRGDSFMTFKEVSMLVCRIIEHQEQKHRARLKAYSVYIELDIEKFQSYVDMFERLDTSDKNSVGQRTAKQLLTDYDKDLTPQAFSELYTQLDSNSNQTLELPEFLRLLGHLERDRREKEEVAKQEEQKKNGTAKQNVKPKKVTPFNILPTSFEDFLPLYHETTTWDFPK